MTPREIQTVMRKLFYFRVSTVDGYRLLTQDNVLDASLVDSLIQEYAGTNDVIVYSSVRQCCFVARPEAYKIICEYQRSAPSIAVQVVASDFSGRILVEPIGTGVGEHRKMLS
jgi:hypothetical protein